MLHVLITVYSKLKGFFCIKNKYLINDYCLSTIVSIVITKIIKNLSSNRLINNLIEFCVFRIFERELIVFCSFYKKTIFHVDNSHMSTNLLFSKRNLMI